MARFRLGRARIVDPIIQHEVCRELRAVPALPEGLRDGAPLSVRRGGMSDVEGPLGRDAGLDAEGAEKLIALSGDSIRPAVRHRRTLR